MSSTSVSGGTGKRAARFAEGLSSLGHSVDVLAPPDPSWVPPAETGFRLLEKRGGFVNRLTAAPGFDFPLSIADGVSSVLGDYDVVHVFATALPQQAVPSLFARIMNKTSRVIVDWDDLWGFDLPKGKLRTRILFPIMWTLQVGTISLSDRLCVVSPQLRVFAERAGIQPRKIIVVPNGCSVDRIVPGDKLASRHILGLDDYPIVLVLGYPYANGYYANAFRQLFEAFDEVRKAIPSIHLMMVGKKTIPQSLSPYYGKVRDATIETGEVPFSSISPLLACADVLYFPMDPTLANDYYRWPMRFCDYLASGKPIVSNAVGAVREVMSSEACARVSESDPKQIADGILGILQDNQLARELGQKARLTAEKYSVTRIGKLVETLYESAE